MGRKSLFSAFDGSSASANRFIDVVPGPVRAALSGKNISLLVLAGAVSASSLTFAAQSDTGSSADGQAGSATDNSSQRTTELTKQDSASDSQQAEASAGSSQQSNTQASNEASLQTEASLSVNGQDIPIPENGSHSEVITTGDGTTSVTVSSQQNSVGTGNNGSSTTSWSYSAQSSAAQTNNSNVRSERGTLP